MIGQTSEEMEADLFNNKNNNEMLSQKKVALEVVKKLP